MNLQTKIKDAGSAFKLYAKRLEKLQIFTLEDLLFHLPHRYDDYSLVSKIAEVQPGETVTIQGKIVEIKNNYLPRKKSMQRAKVQDTTGEIDITWFNQPFLTKYLQVGDEVSLSGTVHKFGAKLSLGAPKYEKIAGNAIHTARLVPVYPETRGVTSKWLRRQIYKLLEEELPDEYLPQEILKTEQVVDLPEALKTIHFPKDLEQAQKARERLAFDELFLLQLAAIKRRSEWRQNLTSHIFTVAKHKKKMQEFYDSLPFELTSSQQKVIQDMYKDMATKEPMNRLIQGDVGSGKTVVAAAAMYLAHLNKFQSVLMAPTEILATQHYQTIFKLLFPLGVKVAVATGSKKANIENFDILIGTHAVLSKKIEFEKLGLVVIDEQQRFGVEQRAVIRGKGTSPHVLTMTATPIPRTIALTLYSDLDVSYLHDMPKGRQTIKTWLVPPEKREGAYTWIEKEIKDNDSQAFIICPFIEESESMTTVKAAKVEFERLKEAVFPQLKLGLLHGKIKGKEKDEVLQVFKNRKYDILVATPVVEVGIDIPNATIMMIEAADRFGLSQLHQLRGRVGRGDKQSYCLLFTESQTLTTSQRLKSMERFHSGFELAELDLKLRGPGEMYGTMQHGRRMLKVATFSDTRLIERARDEAEKLFPKLQQYPELNEKAKQVAIKQVSPD